MNELVLAGLLGGVGCLILGVVWLLKANDPKKKYFDRKNLDKRTLKNLLKSNFSDYLFLFLNEYLPNQGHLFLIDSLKHVHAGAVNQSSKRNQHNHIQVNEIIYHHPHDEAGD